MNRAHTHPWVAGALMVALGAGLAGCDDYNPPPEVELRVADGGIWTKDTPLELVFSEAIAPESLTVTIWPNEVDLERELLPTAVPLVSECVLSAGACGDAGFTMALAADGTVLTMTLGDAFDVVEGEPLLIEVHGGLSDLAGRERVPSTFFDFQVTPSAIGGPVDIELESGLFTMCADLAPTVPVWLRMAIDIEIDEETGLFVGAGTFVRQTDDSPGTNNCQAQFLDPDLTDKGFAVVFTGLVTALGDDYFLQSDAADLSVTVAGIVPVVLADFQLSGTIIPKSKSGAERDTFSGTMAASGAVFTVGANEVEVDAITRSWEGEGVDPNAIYADIPLVCSEDPCEAMGGAGGDCQMENWVPPESCE